MASQAQQAVAVAADRDPKVLYLKEQPGRTKSQIVAAEVSEGSALNAITAQLFVGESLGGEMGITDAIDALKTQVERVNGGDLKQIEGMLLGQAHALTAIFHECARRSAMHMGKQADVMERYMRLALKAQGQCRTTLEALVEAKNPRSVAFVRQANIANQQQVNNHGERANDSPQNEQMERVHGERMDTRASSASIRSHPAMEALESVHRPANA